MVGWGYGTSDPEPQHSLEESDISWNTHKQLKEVFGYPNDDEFFADWLNWFYENLMPEQRKTLRHTPLNRISTGAFPSPPHSTKE